MADSSPPAPKLTLPDDRGHARRLLQHEAGALEQLAASLTASFDDTVTTLSHLPGRVVVTGMGKSGHIASKIAATLASTGTPAFFVHPAEAGHGDLGMITREDAVLALSNSGETAELAAIIQYCKRFMIPLVAVTSKAESALGRAANFLLQLPAVEEACPMGLAPTTSTTMMLALGDALAVAILERKGFSAQQFKVYHPGGSLGKALLKVHDLMHGVAELPLVGLSTLMVDALPLMNEAGFGVLGVVDGFGNLAGIITDGDLRRHVSNNLLTLAAKDIMTTNPTTIKPDAMAAEAVAIMTLGARKINCVFVTKTGLAGDPPLGLLHIHDCLKAKVHEG